MVSIRWMSKATRQLGALAALVALSGALGLPTASSAGQAQAATLAGQNFDETMTLVERPLRLNGLGLRGVAWIKAFVAGIYLSTPTKDSAEVLAQPGPKRLRLRIMLNASSHELTKSLTGRIADHEPEALRAQLADRLNKLAALIDGLGDLHEGDTVDLDFIPDKGLALRFNEKSIGAPVAGDDLYRSVLRIFVGDHPVDRRMKAGLLRGGY